MAEEKITYNYCMGTGCHEVCVLTTHVQDGHIVRTEETSDPNTGRWLNGICQKGIDYVKFPYMDHPNRLKYPLKRVGKRGEGKFERISWEQAFDEIGEKLAKIRDENGPEAVLVNDFASSYPGVFSAVAMPLLWRFIHKFGASILPWTPVDVGLVWSDIFDFGTFFGVIGYDTRRMKDASKIIVWGASPIGWTMASNTSRNFMEAKEAGAKMITVGAVFDSTAAVSDQFIPIKPGTDVYMALAMCNILFRDNLIDPQFLSTHTVAPFLVREDTGGFLRESEVVPGGDPQKYVVWNTMPAVPMGVAAHSPLPEGCEPDLFAQPVVNGIRCATALVKIRDEVAAVTPEEQEKYTGVPAEVVEKLTRDYVLDDDALLMVSTGMRYQNGGPACRAVTMIAALAGKIGKGKTLGFASGGQLAEYPVTFNDLPIIFPDGDPSLLKGKFPLTIAEMLEAGFPYKALLNFMGNPVQTWPNKGLWTDTIFPKLDLIVVHEVRLSDTALYADYVLPDTTTFERYELAVKDGHLILCEPAIPPVGESRSISDVLAGISKRLGIGEYFDKTQKEWVQSRLASPDPVIAGIEPALTWERLEKDKVVRLNVPNEPFNVWGRMDFPTDSGRVEIYSEHLAGVGQAVPHFFPAVIHGPTAKKYPFQLYVGRHRVFMQSQFSEFGDLRQIAGEKPWMRLHPQDAAAKGIKDGDTVEVFNDRGSFRLPVHLSESIRPGTAFVWMAYAMKEWDGDTPQTLMEPLGTPEREDLLLKATQDYARSHMPFPETMDMELHIPVSWETMWDNVCDVRKA
jgi:molybdopterin-containing oxidoreductase family molybdopterin binding subunit